MSEKHPVRVTIFHQDYSVTAQGDPGDLVRAASTVDELMVTIASHSSTVDSTRIAVLACLHMADRLLRAERNLLAMQTKSAAIGDLLDREIGPSGTL